MSTDKDIIYLTIAKNISNFSKDPIRKVGAIIVNPQNKIIATGYNGFPRKVKESEQYWKKYIKDAYVIHAEVNAILNADSCLNNSTLYCTYKPCINCLLYLINTGIKNIVYSEIPKTESDIDIYNTLIKYFNTIKYIPTEDI